jgi:Holliday junction DNA helicase RuvA
MIGSLRGVLTERDREGEVMVEVAGVGWRVRTTPATAVSVGDIGDDVFVYIYHHINDKTQVLFGFLSSEERQMFEAIISAQGIGPAMGLAILGVHGPAELRDVLIAEDIGALSLVPGVGKKTAQKLLLALKSKIVDIDLDLTSGALGSGASSATSDAREALLGLGYSDDAVRDALRDLPTEESSEALLKAALQRLASTS